MKKLIKNLENLQEKIVSSELAKLVTIEEIQALASAKKYIKAMEELNHNLEILEDDLNE